MCTNRFINNSFNNNATNFDDGIGASLPMNLRYGSAYVPNQIFRNVYSPNERFSQWLYVF